MHVGANSPLPLRFYPREGARCSAGLQGGHVDAHLEASSFLGHPKTEINPD